jgi:ribonuclease J
VQRGPDPDRRHAVGEIIDEVLRDRRHLAGDGLVVPVVVINGQTGELESPPEIVTRGMAVDARHDDDAAGRCRAC